MADSKADASRGVSFAPVLVILAAAIGGAFLWFGRSSDEGWSLRWFEQVDDGQAVALWYRDAPEEATRIALVDLQSGETVERADENGTLSVVTKTPGVLWVRREGGLMAIELPSLTRHRVEGALRGHPRLSSHYRVAGKTIDRLVVRDAEGGRYTVAATGDPEPLGEDVVVEVISPSEDYRSTRGDLVPWEGAEEALSELGDRASFVHEGESVVRTEEGALVHTEAPSLALLGEDGVRWRKSWQELTGSEDRGRILWASARGRLRAAIATRRVEGEGEGASYVFAAHLVTFAQDGAVTRMSLLP
ncbi:MAG: hypothetical protein AAGE52_11105 [Myxococcota bacterium]